MDDIARAAAEDGIELVLAGGREALVAAGLVARKAIAEVPAPRALADVARERADVPDLRRRHRGGRFSEHGKWSAQRLVTAERVEGDEAAEGQSRRR
jgi:hypothetical protein